MSPRRSPTSACVAAAILISLRAAAASPSFASGIKGGGLSLLLPGGDEVYPSCAVQKIVDFKTLSDCAICTNSNKHGALNSEACKSCCADSVTGSSNQAVVCTVGGCCIRLLLDLSTNSTVFVAEELTATGRDSGSTACVLAESAACEKCALGANGGNLVSCPNGFAIPAFTGDFSGPVTCDGRHSSANPRDERTVDTGGNANSGGFPVLGFSLCLSIVVAAVAVCVGCLCCRQHRGDNGAAPSSEPTPDGVPAAAAAVKQHAVDDARVVPDSGRAAQC